jgi:acyl-CoA hydrolase
MIFRTSLNFAGRTSIEVDVGMETKNLISGE